jgi:UPF0755 protein
MRRLFAVIVLVGLLAGAGWAWWAFAWPSGPRSETFVEIPSGTTTREIAAQLQRSGIISSAGAFEALHLLGGTLKAGEYRFAHAATVTAVYRRIARGDVFTVAVTIPEGANIFDIASRLEAAGLGPRANFLAAAKANTALVAKIDPRAASLEGYLFPSTYRFGRRTAPAEVLRTMVRQFAVEAAALDLTGDVHRTVTLASLVERETPIAAERPLVASVFENRLAKGMPLETDPTVIYAALLRGQYRGSIYQSDLQFDSPFNTYRHAGLPPGPICNPGAVSLRAAMHPAHTDYLYFVAAGADPLGQSRFATTLEQHQRNVAAYRAAVRAGVQPH